MVRWRCASALRLPPSRLLPGAANKAQKAKKGEEEGPKRYPAGRSLELVERDGHAAAIARHEDGDGAAVLPIEEAQLASSGSVRRARDGSRRIAGFDGSSTDQIGEWVGGRAGSSARSPPRRTRPRSVSPRGGILGEAPDVGRTSAAHAVTFVGEHPGCCKVMGHSGRRPCDGSWRGDRAWLTWRNASPIPFRGPEATFAAPGLLSGAGMAAGGRLQHRGCYPVRGWRPGA